MNPHRAAPAHLRAGHAPLSAARNIRAPWWRRLRAFFWSRTGTGKVSNLDARLADSDLRGRMIRSGIWSAMREFGHAIEDSRASFDVVRDNLGQSFVEMRVPKPVPLPKPPTRIKK